MTETSEESKALNLDPTPKVIISASGMCDAGRIRHHLKHNLWRPECTVVFVASRERGPGPQPAGGHQERPALRRGDRRPRQDRQLPGPFLPRRPGPSACLDPVHPGPQAPARVHRPRGPGGGTLLCQERGGLGLHCPRAPVYGGLRPDCRRIVDRGYLPERKTKTTTGGARASAAYERLVAVGNLLMESIKRSKGRDNKSLLALPISFASCWRSGSVSPGERSRYGKARKSENPHRCAGGGSAAGRRGGYTWPRMTLTGPSGYTAEGVADFNADCQTGEPCLLARSTSGRTIGVPGMDAALYH